MTTDPRLTCMSLDARLDALALVRAWLHQDHDTVRLVLLTADENVVLALVDLFAGVLSADPGDADDDCPTYRSMRST